MFDKNSPFNPVNTAATTIMITVVTPQYTNKVHLLRVSYFICHREGCKYKLFYIHERFFYTKIFKKNYLFFCKSWQI